MGRIISPSLLSQISGDTEDYECQYDWPEDCFVQCGGDGVVFTERSMEESFADPVSALADVAAGKGHYRTAFFEAFPRQPDTFIRGEGKTVADAEAACWQKYERIAACQHQNGFERRDYRNGVGFCVDCGMSSINAFDPLETCVICGRPTYFTHDIDDNWYCESCEDQKPIEKWTELDRMTKAWLEGVEDV